MKIPFLYGIFLLIEKIPMCYYKTVMRYFLLSIYVFSLCTVVMDTALANDDFYTYTVNNDVNTTIYLSQDTKLINHSIINSPIETMGYNLDVYNYGTINGMVGPSTGFIRQYVSSDDTLNKINVDSGSDFYIYISNLSNVNLGDIKNLGDAEFNITNSVIVIDNFEDWQNWSANVKLDSTDTLIILNPDTIISGQQINHVTTPIEIKVKDLDKYYKIKLSHDTGVFLINVTRETDYVKDLNDERGELLEKIRNANPDDSLLYALDNATSTEELVNIMNASYRFNSSVLLKPIKTINHFMMLDNALYHDSLYGNMSGFYLFADKTNDYGFDINIDGKYNFLYLSAGFNLHNFNYKDNLNDFTGWMYGFNLKAKTYIDSFWVNGLLNLSFTRFNVDDVVYNDEIKNNPVGCSGYGILDVGYDYHIISDFVISPFIGVFVEHNSVLNVNDSDYNIRGGGNVKYSFATDNIKYVYSGKGGVYENRNVFAGIGVGFISEIDNAGVSVDCDFLKTEEEKGYKISVSGHISF